MSRQALTLGGSRVALHDTAAPPDEPPLIVDVPELELLTEAERGVLAAHAIPASVGLGAVIAPLVLHLARLGDDPGAAPERHRLAVVLRGLLSAAAAERVDDDWAPVAAHDRVTVRAMQLIHARLGEAHLSSAVIAAELGVPLRTLQAAFQESGTSVRQTLAALRSE
ncbi:hypothetical protein ACEXQD_08585 [Herbiconiux sp. P15]|uniref:hypothetical protein n=1 Tax=Herbiconiux liukaitaii TaxID=3342799 RepID=UPI0035BAC0DC